jgi:hypothetical protein
MLKKKLFQLVVGSLVPPKSSVKCGQGRTWTKVIGVAKNFRYYWKKKLHPDNFS